MVADLDNFKNANDTYGHDVGDKIINHCGILLKNIFGDKSTFRILGDEYYIFVSKEEFPEMIKQLKIVLDRSEILKEYGVCISIGYFFKSIEMNIFDAFKKANIGMYKAKKIKGNIFYHED
ncbi:diguanylate cyclase [Cetobacterium somerae]